MRHLKVATSTLFDGTFPSNETQSITSMIGEPNFSQSIAQSPEVALYAQKGRDSVTRVIHPQTSALRLYQNTLVALVETIRWPALTQSIKGLLTGGIVRSWNYVLAKLRKASSK